jgi:hypothetical protein
LAEVHSGSSIQRSPSFRHDEIITHVIPLVGTHLRRMAEQ